MVGILSIIRITECPLFSLPTASNSITTADANYANSVGTVTDVGTYSSDGSYYGTFDQGGNVFEWNDTIVSTSDRGLRGGSFSNDGFNLQSSTRLNNNPTSCTTASDSVSPASCPSLNLPPTPRSWAAWDLG